MKKLNKDNSPFDNSVEAYACGCGCACTCWCNCSQGCGVDLGPSRTAMYQSNNGVYGTPYSASQSNTFTTALYGGALF